ncbi:hypothetical protein [Maribacter aurantiacus]|uniref:META domain-containing protein n=1 Tax=Maribacter aurantiacus TaxID=1882343 RepID=A0A5R8MBT6_9FLAO|nr:hypothetical protein [Maribacter aurantiacus]TLF47028.1 hypothetical protein FEK29_04475 [Maribacter aurantiacus]
MVEMFGRYFYIVFLSLLSIGCSKDEEFINETLLGKWELIAYYDQSTRETKNPPIGSDSIKITFEIGDFQGSTGRNTFFGNYISELSNLSLLSLNGTEIAESEWGTLFFQTITSTYNSNQELFIMEYTIERNILNIEYAESRFMLFKAIQ